MEAGDIMKTVKDSFHHIYIIIDVIVSKNGSTMQYVLKHPSISVQGQVMKSSNENLDN